jgi:hypothetical protein
MREARASGPIVLPATALAEILVGASRAGDIGLGQPTDA